MKSEKRKRDPDFMEALKVCKTDTKKYEDFKFYTDKIEVLEWVLEAPRVDI